MLHSQPWTRGYDPPMAQFQRFTHTNGKSVTKVTTSAGVCFIADELPVEALIVMRDEIARRYNIPIPDEEGQDAPDAATGARGGRSG